jgi:hypothetical protein
MGEAPADNLYVAFDPANDLPSMALGRLPVKTVSEANTIVQKILAYPQTTSGAWSKKVMLVADASDDAGNFSADSDAFGSQLPSRFMVDKIYLPQGLTASSPILAAARQNILNGLNDGRLIVHYTGHSAIFFWSTLNLFQNTKISSLTNLSKLPFVLSMTCYLGYYVIPSPTGHDYSSFDELLVRASNGGAIATWSPTGEGLSSEHALLDAGFTQAAFNNHLSQIGLSTNQAKYYLYANSVDDHELIDTYLLLGDPALSLPLFEVFMPSIQR